jgi:hypothetical protein
MINLNENRVYKSIMNKSGTNRICRFDRFLFKGLSLLCVKIFNCLAYLFYLHISQLGKHGQR